MQKFLHSLILIKSTLLGFLLLCIVSCGPEKTAKVEEPIVGTKQEKQETPPQEENARDYWQKPELVLERLGDVKDKVVVDIGAGIGYFAFPLTTKKPKKVIAVDIDPKMIETLNLFKQVMADRDSTFRNRFEARLAEPNDPLLKDGEADIILIVNTTAFFNNRIKYLSNLKSKLKNNGKLVIVDFKAKRLDPEVNPPAFEDRIPLFQMEKDLVSAGFENFSSDDTALKYQYIITASK